MAYYNPNAPIFFSVSDVYPSFGSLFKTNVIVVSRNLIEGTYVLMDATDTFLTLVDFTNPSSGVIQYTGGKPGVYTVTYNISSLLNATTQDLVFVLQLDGVTVLGSSVQIINVAQTYVVCSGTAQFLINPGQQIALYCKALSADDIIEVQNIAININKIL